MTVAPLTLEVMWDATNWTDETVNLLMCSWRRGRDYASQLTGRSSAGTLDVTLNNPAGRYAPLNTAGALYGNILPGRKVRLRGTPLNLCTNPSFEDATITTEWALYNNGPEGATLVRSTAAPNSGVAHARVNWTVPNTSTKGVQHLAKVPLRPSTTFTISWYAKATNAIATGMGLYWNVAPASTTQVLNPNVTTSYQRYVFVVTMASTVDPNIFISITSGFAAAANDLDIDDVQIELGSTVSAFSSTGPVVLWQGFLDEIRPSPGSRDAAPTAALKASGPLRWIADKKASTAVYTSVLTGTAVGYILDDAGWPAGDRTLDAGQITMNRWKADGNSALSHLQELEEMEFGYIGESKDGKVVWEDANHRVTLTTSQATFSDNNGATLPYDDVDELDPWRDVYNIFSADVTLYTVQGLAVLWSLVGETPSINPGATKDFWTVYPNPSSATQADSVDAWTTPAITTDYLANTQADGLGTNKSAAITVAVSKFANTMKISLTNTDAGVVYITLLQARGTAVYKNNPIRIVSEDSASQTKFGKRTFPLPGKFYPSTTVAKSYVDAGIARFKDQLAVLSIRYQADQSSNHMTQALTRTVGERISVVANGTLASGAQLGIVGDFFIEAEQHQTDLSGHWVTYQLSDARTVSGYWLLGTNLLGTDTKLAL